MDPLVAKLSPGLFWDVNRETIDSQTHRAWIVERVLERGSFSDWCFIRDAFTIPGIVAEAKTLRTLEPTALAFISCVGNESKENFRCCTTKPSTFPRWDS